MRWNELTKELELYLQTHEDAIEMCVDDVHAYVTRDDLAKLAQHFYELGREKMKSIIKSREDKR